MKNYSKQREKILKIVKELKNHPTAEEVYSTVKRKDTTISMSTVYRNLNELVENDILLKIPMLSGNDRFEYIQDREKHGHIVCNKCGNIKEFAYNDKISNVVKEILKNTDFVADDKFTVLNINTVCNLCKEN